LPKLVFSADRSWLLSTMRAPSGVRPEEIRCSFTTYVGQPPLTARSTAARVSRP
jgi:hypothetical protein